MRTNTNRLYQAVIQKSNSISIYFFSRLTTTMLINILDSVGD